jgi:hypothetical protein
MQLKSLGDSIWIYEGSTVSFYGFPFPTRMTVIKLASGELWIHSPEKLNDGLKQELSSLGEVKYLISPNKLHHLFLSEWIDTFPEALAYASPGLSNKRRDIKFDVALVDKPEMAWCGEIEQMIFRGSPLMEEVVFYHKRSKTVILTDLIENFKPSTLNCWQRLLADFAGILYPDGKTPIDWRVSFLFGDKAKAQESLQTLLSWNPENVVLSHGEYALGNGKVFLERSFTWLSN